MPAEFVNKLFSGEAVVGGMVEQSPVGRAVEGVFGDLFEVEPSTGASTRAASATAVRHCGMWWMMPKSNTAS